MTTPSKHKFAIVAQFAVALAWLFAFTATAQVAINNVTVVNVTPLGFSLVASVSPAIPASSTVAVRVFSDPLGATSLAGQIGVEYYPLNSGNPAATTPYSTLLSQAALRQDAVNLGLVYARLSDCAPNTTYYYQIAVTDTNGQSVLWPPGGPLPSATTAQENSFVVQAQQLLVTLNSLNPPGSIITLSNANSSSVLAALVGDGANTNQAFFNVNDLIAISGGTNYSPLGSQLFTASVLGSSSAGFTQTYNLIFSNSFSVGQAGFASLGALSAEISIGEAVIVPGGSGFVPITLNSQSALVNLSFLLNLPTNLFTAISLQSSSLAVGAASLTALSANVLQLSFTAASGTNLAGSRQIAQLNFTTVAGQSSVFLPLSPQNPQGTNSDPSIATAFVLGPGQVIIVGPQPLLDMQLVNNSPNLFLYGIPGQSYQIQSLTNLALPGNWSNYLLVPMSNLVQVFSPLPPPSGAVFFRAYEVGPPPHILPESPAGKPSPAVVQLPVLNYTLTNSSQPSANLSGSDSPVVDQTKKQ